MPRKKQTPQTVVKTTKKVSKKTAKKVSKKTAKKVSKKTAKKAGKKVPKTKKYLRDDNGETAVVWARRMRKEKPLAPGGVIACNFPDGPDGGVWEKSYGSFAAHHNNDRLGTYASWDEARIAIRRVSQGKPAPVPPKRRRNRQAVAEARAQQGSKKKKKPQRVTNGVNLGQASHAVAHQLRQLANLHREKADQFDELATQLEA